eukprot:4225499-Amphidinium_carterae.1
MALASGLKPQITNVDPTTRICAESNHGLNHTFAQQPKFDTSDQWTTGGCLNLTEMHGRQLWTSVARLAEERLSGCIATGHEWVRPELPHISLCPFEVLLVVTSHAVALR